MFLVEADKRMLQNLVLVVLVLRLESRSAAFKQTVKSSVLTQNWFWSDPTLSIVNLCSGTTELEREAWLGPGPGPVCGSAAETTTVLRTLGHKTRDLLLSSSPELSLQKVLMSSSEPDWVGL